MKRTTGLWLLIGLFGYAILPWYALKRGFWSFEWGAQFGEQLSAPALFNVLNYGRFGWRLRGWRCWRRGFCC